MCGPELLGGAAASSDELRAALAAQVEVITKLRAVIATQAELYETELARRDAALAARDAVVDQVRSQAAGLAERVAELERSAARNSSNSSKPPSSDSPYTKKTNTRQRTDRSLRGRSGRKPGKQPGEPGASLSQVADPDEVVVCAPDRCDGCGCELADAPVTGVQQRQEFEVRPPPPRPLVTAIRCWPPAPTAARCPRARQRTGRANTARGAGGFVDELAARVRRAGASGELTMRADSGFWSAKTIKTCRRHRIHYSITVRQTKLIRQAIATISEDTWVDIVYPEGGLAQVAETRYKGDRLIVRRTRLVGQQAELFPNWRYHAFITDRVGTTVWLDQDHRRHAVVELCIRDLKAGVGLRHCPSGKFNANAAWLQIATLAHNLLRWVAAIGLGARDQLVVAKTLRRTLLALPGRLTRSARRLLLHLPAGWPWAAWFELALARLRCIAYAT